MIILEEHNRQLETQLGKLKQILEVRTTFICCKIQRKNVQRNCNAKQVVSCDRRGTMLQSCLKFCHNKLIILFFVTYKLSDFNKNILSSIIFIINLAIVKFIDDTGLP